MTQDVAGRVRLEREGHLAWVTLSHPGRLNAITVGMWRELQDVFTQIGADDAVRCVIVRGEGGNFAAGADIREFPVERADMAGVQRYHREILAPALQAVAACPQPVIAQIDG
ncbi:MAG: enoyl-CoA hydratase/isomerase family protein, partial [Achromobacter pestifer]